MRVVARRNWGSDRKSLTLLYTALIRSKIDYGSFLYSTAKKSHLERLDRVQYKAIRIIAGLLLCTSLDALEAEVNLLPLKFRRAQLMLQYFSRVLRVPDHPVTVLYHDFYNFDFYRYRPYSLPVVGRARLLMERAQVPVGRLERVTVPDLYLIGNPVVRYNMLPKRKDLPPEVHRLKFSQLKHEMYNDFTQYYTDGSKMNGNTAYAFVVGDTIFSNRLPSVCSVFTAELYAIYKAVQHIGNAACDKAVIFSDSLSSLEAIDHNSTKCHIMFKLQRLLATSNKEIILEYCPAHVGIGGNTKADEAAKYATSNVEYLDVPLHSFDLKPLIKTFTYQLWQSEWDRTPCRMQRLKPVLGDWKSAYRDNRREEVILARLRTNTCLFSVKHYFSEGTPRDFCANCNVRQTVFHLTLQCPHLTRFRSTIMNYFRANDLSINMNNLLSDDFPFHRLFKFLQDVNYYTQI